MMNRDKVRGLLIGGAIGDALGMPVETWTPEKIREVHPPNGIENYQPPIGHKWFTDDPKNEDPKKTYMEAGMTTDDTQLTVATMRGLVIGGEFCMDSQARQHVVALRTGTAGWGKSTEEAIRRLANNVSWKESGKTTVAGRGTGNGIPMKCSPLGAYVATVKGMSDKGFWQRVVDYAAMTHYTKMSAMAGLVHTQAAWYCLVTNPEDYSTDDFLNLSCNLLFDKLEMKIANIEHLNASEDNIEHQMIYLWENRHEIVTWTDEQIRERFGNGSCYVYHSLPFSYCFFIHNPFLLDGAFRCINAGGDTDTNAKIVMELVGALNGYSFFQTPAYKYLLDGLKDHDELLDLADRFCEDYEVVDA